MFHPAEGLAIAKDVGEAAKTQGCFVVVVGV
jgi:hypothetical protein